jgi:hypothetical protein
LRWLSSSSAQETFSEGDGEDRAPASLT